MKQILFRGAMANAITALLCASVLHGAAQAAEPAKKRDMYYSGEREFCLRLLNNANKAVKIEPVIGPTLTFDLDTGELYAPKTRLYFVKSPLPGPFIHRMVKEGNWKAVLGYTPWKADSTAGRIVYDSRWRIFDEQCPGIFRYRDFHDPKKITDTPTRMTLFNFDADGDGKRDMIYRHVEDATNTQITVADFKTCTLQPIVWQREALNLFQFEGRTYVIAGSGTKMVTVYRVNSLAREIDRNKDTCFYSGIDRITDYLRDRHLINKPEYRR